jgi:GWxTD domain-containing protein
VIRKSIHILTCLAAVILSGFLMNSCTPPRVVTDTKDLSYLYNPLKNSMNPRYSIFNASDEKSILSIKFFSTDLYFNEANSAGISEAMVTAGVRLYNLTHGMAVTDTLLYTLEIKQDKSKQEYLYKLPLNVEKGCEYLAEVKLLDNIRNITVQAFIPFNTLSPFNRYNFYPRGHILKNELLKPMVRRGEFFNLVYGGKKPDSLYISVYKPDITFPYPPSMVLPDKPGPEKADTVVAVAYSDTLPLMFPKRGIFFCSVGRVKDEGYTFYNFGPEFPGMSSPEEMLEPLCYLASEDEMSTMKANPKPKMALDGFWLQCGSNVEKSRELIRIYYTRVLYANYYFTSYKEGWRTDRGMIYIIYGPPDKIYKTPDGETWDYRKEVIKSSWGTSYSVREEYLEFNFRRKENKFSDNEYSINRSETAVTLWDQAVSSWRKGIVFRADNPADL